jgi:signal transduction histidine kinase/ActR/RegA family two-component response regulator
MAQEDGADDLYRVGPTPPESHAPTIATTMAEFRLGITRLLGRVMPPPVLLACGATVYHSEWPAASAVACAVYIGSNVVLDSALSRRSEEGKDVGHLFGKARIAINCAATGAMVYVGGPTGHGWIPALPLLCVFGHMPGVGAWTSVISVVTTIVVAYLAVGGAYEDVASAAVLLTAVALVCTPMIIQFRGLWGRAVRAGEALESANVELRNQKGQLEMLLREAMQAALAKDRFLANMSHEMRTPLNGILGVVALLRGSALSSEQRELVEIANQSANDLLSEVNDILDLTKLEARRMQIEFEPFNLLGELQQLAAEFRCHPSGEGKQFAFEVSGPVPRWVIGDGTRIRQVVRNMLANALKFTARGGHVALRLEAFPTEDSARVRVRVAVEDDGIGIPPEAHERIFQRFEQVDASTTRKYGGTGLGLAICRQLIEAMGGRLNLESAPGQGSTFWFDLEMQCSNHDTIGPAAAEPARPQQIGGARILLVEDIRINQIVASRLLEKMGCVVEVAGNGVEALDVLSRERFDAVLMDCFMPEMDGFEATRQLRQLEASGTVPRTPVIALTAAASAADRERCFAAGMDDFVPKPILEGELERALGKVFAPPSPPSA